MATEQKTGGERIRELRLKKGMTIKEMANTVSKHYVFLSRLERNMDRPSEELIRQLSKVLDYPGNIDVLIASFGRIPERIEKFILDDPDAMVELPAFFKKRTKERKNG